MSKRLLTQEQAAEFLTLSPRTLADWRCQGFGPRYRKLGTGRNAPVRYREDELEEWLANQVVDPERDAA